MNANHPTPVQLLALTVTVVSVLTIGGTPACAPAEPIRPNVILINVDDLGWTDVGCFGSPHHDTPNIDSLCAGGVKFTNAYAAAAVCSPSRAAIATGRYPTRTGVTSWIRPIDVRPRVIAPDGSPGFIDDEKYGLLHPAGRLAMSPDETTIAEILGAAGYATAHIGKWHLGSAKASPTGQGFQINMGGGVRGQTPSYFDPYQGTPPTPGHNGFPGLPARQPGEYLTDREADEAVGFIRANRDRPFFLNLWHYGVHAPLQGRADLVEKYQARYRERKVGRHRNPTYAAMVESVDAALGRILETLEELGIADETLVLFTSDNGGWKRATTNAPLRGGKGQPYEGGIRVPQIAWWPGRVEPGISSEMVSGIDLLPTIAEATGVALPETTVDGVSLMPLFESPGSELTRDALYWHYPHYWLNEVPYSIVRRGPYKLIRRYTGKRFELFDLSKDPGEKTDLASRMPERTRELNAQLSKWLEETGALLPQPRVAP